jgi:hypothetical protein
MGNLQHYKLNIKLKSLKFHHRQNDEIVQFFLNAIMGCFENLKIKS